MDRFKFNTSYKHVQFKLIINISTTPKMDGEERLRVVDTNVEGFAQAGVRQEGIDWLHNELFDEEGRLKGEDELDLSDPEKRRLWEEAKARQQELFERDRLGEEQGVLYAPRSQDLTHNLGIAPLMRVKIRGHDEQVLRLTESFLPQEDDKIRQKMQDYCGQRMARFRNNLDKKQLENRKRDLKNLLKAANESLRQRTKKAEKRGELPSAQTAALNFLTKERVTGNQLRYMLESRYQHHESIVSVRRPALGKRLKPDGQEAIDDKANTLNEGIKPTAPAHDVPMPTQEKPDAVTNVPQLNIQQIKENLRIIELAGKKKVSQAQQQMDEKVKALRRKLESADRSGIPEGNSVLETLLDAEERQTLKYMLRSKHQIQIGADYPQIPSLVMNETEKACFEFCSKSEERVPDEMAGFGQGLGWHTGSRQKSVFLSSKHGIGAQLTGRADAMATGEVAPQVQQSLFGAFLSKQSLPQVSQQESNLLRKSPDFQDLNVDESESDLIDGSRQSSEDMFEQPPEQLATGADQMMVDDRRQQPLNQEDQQIDTGSRAAQQNGYPQGETSRHDFMLPTDRYAKIKRDAQVQEKMIEVRYERMRPYAEAAGIPLQRTQLWGELKDATAQHQLDRDHFKLIQFENRLQLNKLPPKPVFRVEHIFTDQQDSRHVQNRLEFQENGLTQLPTKYGSLHLSAAHPNNIRIDDYREYEFVQRQRAYLYDPAYLKGSQQLKSFSSQVGLQALVSRHTTSKVNRPTVKAAASMQCDLLADPLMQKLLKSKGLEKLIRNKPIVDRQPDPQEARRLRQQRQLEDMLDQVEDDFDTLTKTVKVDGLELLIRGGVTEHRRTMAADKKIQSTAYKPASLLPIPVRAQPKHEAVAEEPVINADPNVQMSSDQSPEPKSAIVDAPASERADSSSGEQSASDTDPAGKEQGHSPTDVRMSERASDLDSQSSNEDEIFGDDLQDTTVQVESSANHASCILDHTYARFEWALDEDYSTFHRPDVHDSFCAELRQREANAEALRGERDQHDVVKVVVSDVGGAEVQDQLNDGGVEAKETIRLPLDVVDRERVKEHFKTRLKRGIIKPDEHFKYRYRLSIQDGQFALFEHIDEEPLYLNNFGMVSNLERHIFGERPLAKADFLPSSLKLSVKHMGPFGKQTLLNANQKLPLLGRMDRTKYAGITVLSNKLYKAPVFFHRKNQRSEPQDFFCSIHKVQDMKRKGCFKTKVILRELHHVYTVGQIEPLQKVHDPGSRAYQTFRKNRCEAYILRFLKRNNNSVAFTHVQELFPHLSDQKLKKFMRDIQIDIQREICKAQGGLNSLSDDTIKNRISPEDICQYESARFGEVNLSKLGIQWLKKAGKISYACNKYCQEQRELQKQRIAKFIEHEVLCTPWNLSQNFCDINPPTGGQGGQNGMLMIKGVGDPSNGNGGYSFLKMPLKISNDSNLDCMKIRVDLNPAIQNPKSVTGTDADLRKLKKDACYEKLLQVGYQPEDIKKLSRWDMVGLLRESSNTIGNKDDANRRYARGIRYTSKKQKEEYQNRVDDLFKMQMEYLTRERQLHDDSDDEDPAELLVKQSQHEKERKEQHKDVGSKEQTVEIVGEDEITDIMTSIDPPTPGFAPQIQTLNLAQHGPSSGKVKCLKDIPNFRKLLVTKLDSLPGITGSQALQSGQQIGMIRNQQLAQALNPSLPRDEQLEEALHAGTIDYKLEVLKKVIRSSDEDGAKIERIEFTVAKKAIKQFQKNYKKAQQKGRRKNPGAAQTRDDGSNNARSGSQKVTPDHGGGKSSRSKAQQSIAGLDSIADIDAALIANRQGGRNDGFKVPKNKAPSKSGTKGKQPAEVNFKVDPGTDAAPPLIRIDAEGLNDTSDVYRAEQLPPDTSVNIVLGPLESDYLEPQHHYQQPARRAKPSTSKKSSSKSKPKQKSHTEEAGGYGHDRLIATLEKDQEDNKAVNQKFSSLRRAKKSGEGILAAVAVQIVERLMKNDSQNWFLNAVTKHEAPGYQNVIKDPMWLLEIRQKAKREEYRSIEAVMADITLMKDNCIRFNDKDGPVRSMYSLKAIELERIAQEMIEQPGPLKEQIEQARAKLA